MMAWAQGMLALLLVLIAVPSSTNASQGNAASVSDVAVSFPQGVTITSTFPVEAVADDDITLVWSPRSADTDHLSHATVTPASNGSVDASVTLNFQQDFIPAGITINYQWMTGSSPLLPLSEQESFDWFDTRWDWSTASDESITVHTYGTDSIDADMVLSSATDTLETMQEEYGALLSQAVSIWVYPSMSDFSSTMQSNAREAVAGTAYPEYGVISAILPASQPAELNRIIPHEISHQVLSQATDNAWNHPPLWFDEGMAVYLQTGGTSSYELILDRSVNDGAMYGLDALSYTFPYNPADASLAYAQSWSIVSWLHESYGAEGVARLIEAFGEGTSWDTALNVALGLDIQSLEAQWLSSLGERAESTDARLLTETYRRDQIPGNVSKPWTSQQEIDEWSLKPNSTARRFSIPLRSSGNSRSIPTTWMPTALTFASSTIRFACRVSGNSASTAARLPATRHRTMAPSSSPMRAASSAAAVASSAMCSTTSSGPTLAAVSEFSTVSARTRPTRRVRI